MATNSENDYPPSPTNDESDEEELRTDIKEEEPNDSVARILKQLQNTGALIKKPKQEYRCNTCDENYRNWEELENHLIQHVTLPSIILEKLPSDDELDHSGDENWSDEDDLPTIATKAPPKTPQKIDVSQFLQNKGVQIKPATPNKGTDALNKLSGLGFTIKKNVIKEEKEDKPSNNDLMQKLGSLGGIKLKLKSDGNSSNTFKVINGLKDFKTSDDEDGSGNEEPNESDEEHQKEQEASGAESADEQNKDSDDSMEKIPLARTKNLTIKPNPKLVTPKVEDASDQASEPAPSGVRRPNVKQTPKRSPANLPLGIQIKQAAQAKTAPAKEVPASPIAQTPTVESNSSPVVVKTEVDDGAPQSDAMPMFTDRVKTERSSPPIETVSTPLISRVKSESEPPATDNAQPLFSNNTINTPSTQPLLPVTKTEDSSMTIIEINGDSNDEDDDCCVVSATPAPDVKPVIPKTENTTSYASPTTYPSLQTSYSATTTRPIAMTEKQHSFNWNAPDSKPAIDVLERSADDIFESLLSSTKKEGGSLSDTNEYISLDRLGSQHTCDICNTRFTDSSLLDDHIRTTGHSKSIVMPSSAAMMSYNQQSPLLASLLPVKQLAEQVGKLSTIANASSPYTHQQNVMINIQAYPGGGMAPPPYNSYPSGQNMQPNYSQPQNNMYSPQGQSMPNQYQGSPYMGQQGYGQQYQQPMSKPGYPGQVPQSPYTNQGMSSPYSTASPLQSMQQAVYGQSQMNPPQAQMSQMGSMGPPSMPSPGHPYGQASSPGGSMKPPMNPPMNSASGIRIQNVQSFTPTGQLIGPNGQPVQPGQVASAQSPGQVRVAGPGTTGPRPRMPGAVRGARPSIRPGIQVQGQVRGPRPRMQMKRPGGAPPGPPLKRRPDMLLPGKHDNEDCQVMAMQRQREGLPMIQSVQGAKDKLNLGSQISITKKTVPKESSAMAMLASRGISIKKKQKSRSPSPERPMPHIPNLPAGMSIKHTSKTSKFSIPEGKVSSGMFTCRICKKIFTNSSMLNVHMSNVHPQSKVPIFKCDECSAAYPKSLQLQHHKRVFHNVTGPNRELGLPVVDFGLPENLERLSSLGIYSYIPLANREEASGCFGIPVISVHNMQNGMTSNLQALGADGLLSLGPLKPLPNT